MAIDKKKIPFTILSIFVRTLINLMLVVLLYEGVTRTYYFTYKLFADIPYVATSDETYNITIESGQGVSEIGYVLDQTGIVDGQYMFIARAYIGKYQDKIKPGVYTLGPGMSPEEICKVICGESIGEAS